MIAQFLSVHSYSHNYITLEDSMFGCDSYDDALSSNYYSRNEGERMLLDGQLTDIKSLYFR